MGRENPGQDTQVGTIHLGKKCRGVQSRESGGRGGDLHGRGWKAARPRGAWLEAGATQGWPGPLPHREGGGLLPHPEEHSQEAFSRPSWPEILAPDEGEIICGKQGTPTHILPTHCGGHCSCLFSVSPNLRACLVRGAARALLSTQ